MFQLKKMTMEMHDQVLEMVELEDLVALVLKMLI